MSDGRIDKPKKTIYQSGKPMYTPMDPFVHKEVQRLKDHIQLEGYVPPVDPLLEGPYAATTQEVPPPPKPAPAKPKEDPATQGVSRPIYTGGAPALRPDQMDQAVVDGNLILKTLYSLPEKYAFLRTGYMGITRVLGPAGAVLNLGYNLVSAKRILSDPKAPLFLKGGIVASTGLAGLSAVTAGRMAASAFGWAPMATDALKSMGKVCGLAGLGAGTILSAMDTFNTFRDPNATPAEKGFSTLATVSSLGLTAVVLLGITGPIGIGLGIGAVAFSLFKGWFAKNKTANAVFGAVGGFVKKLKFW
ncbi:MAG: hypothetical protein JWM80_3086 [Cyanobacteria bacterium RYN_339]|nr:hypothetical protein [Cyanobacteria bacterium RYN_339]